MKIEKKHLDEMKRCYCASNISFDGENHVLLASEDPEVACNMYYGKAVSYTHLTLPTIA